MISRWKDCEPASLWVMRFTLYHKLLQRTLGAMEHKSLPFSNPENESLVNTLVSLCERSDRSSDRMGALQKALDEFLDADVSHAAVNSKRAHSVIQMLTRPDIQDMAVLIYTLSHTLEVAMNNLLDRSSKQSELHMQMEFQNNSLRSFSHLEESFLRFVDGSFGASLVLGYVKLLDGGVKRMMYLTNSSFTAEHVTFFFRQTIQPWQR